MAVRTYGVGLVRFSLLDRMTHTVRAIHKTQVVTALAYLGSISAHVSVLACRLL